MGVARDILRILKLIPRQNPGSLQESLGVSLSSIKNALIHLTDMGLVDTPSRGVYIITNLGKYVLENTPMKMRRTCPVCDQEFKPMTDALWRINLYQHLIASKKHFMDPEEAKKHLPPDES